MRAPKRIWLHCGLHKTGTSTIQSFLYKYADEMERQLGFFYPRTGLFIGAHHEIAYACMNTRKKDIGTDLIKALNRETVKKDHLVITSEEFEYLTEEEIITLKNNLEFDELGVIFFLRRQDELINSVYNQQIKTGATLSDFNDFFCQWVDKERFNFLTILTRWERVFERDNMYVLPIENGRVGDATIIQAFLNVIEPGWRQCQLAPEILDASNELAINPSVSKRTLEIIRHVVRRKTSEWSNQDWISYYRAVILPLIAKCDALGWNDSKALFLEPWHVQILKEKFHETNKRVAQRFLDGAPELFATPWPINTSAARSQYPVLSQGDILDVLGVIVHQDVDPV